MQICSGSSEAGSTEQMWSSDELSKHLLKMGVRATGPPVIKHVILFFLGMGTVVDFLKHEGTTDSERDRLKMSVKTTRLVGKPHALSTRPGSHPGPQLCGCSPFEGLSYIRDRKGEWDSPLLRSCGAHSVWAVL